MSLCVLRVGHRCGNHEGEVHDGWERPGDRVGPGGGASCPRDHGSVPVRASRLVFRCRFGGSDGVTPYPSASVSAQ